MNSTKVFFHTSDFVTIFGDFYKPENATSAVLLLHMMPATRSSFEPLQKELTDAGIASLAIDLRGHGESTMNGTLNYKNFPDKEHQASRLDVDAAINFLKTHGFAESALSFVGASIGANLSLDALDRYKETRAAILLSPGLNYRGIETLPALSGISAQQKVWFIAGEEDEYSAESVETLYKKRPENSQLTIYKSPDHGTDLFASESNLVKEIVAYLKP